MMDKEIIVTKHALEQYLRRVNCARNTDTQSALKKIEGMIKNGKIAAARPGDAWEVEYEGVGLVCRIEDSRVIVITCLGDRIYRGWARKTEIQPRYRARQAS